MPANRVNYIVLYTTDSQVYATATKQIALDTPPPNGVAFEDKRVLFIAYQPDNEILSVHPLPQEEVLQALHNLPEAEPPKKKTKKKDKDVQA